MEYATGSGTPIPVLVLAALWNESGPISTLTDSSVGHCISLTRAGLEILWQCGVKAKPLPCSLMVANLEGVRAVLANRPMSEWPADAWTVGVAAIRLFALRRGVVFSR